MANKFTNNLFLIANVFKNLKDDRKDLLDLDPVVVNSGKITKFISKFVITPLIVVDENLKYYDQKKLSAIVTYNVTMFSAVVIESMRLLGEIYGLSPDMVVNRVSSSNLKISDVIDAVAAREDYLSDFYDYDYMDVVPSTENNNDTSRLNDLINPVDRNFGNRSSVISSSETELQRFFHKDNGKFMQTYNVNFTIRNDRNRERVVSIPIIVLPMVIYTDGNSLIENMLEGDYDKTFIARWYEYRAGRISLADLIFATDLVKKYRERKVKNPNEIASLLNKIDKASDVKSIITGYGFSRNYNMYILHSSLIPTINNKLHGKIFNRKYKDKLTDQLMAFSVEFVNPEDDSLIILLDEIGDYTVTSISNIKTSGDKDDVSEIIKALVQNRMPF